MTAPPPGETPCPHTDLQYGSNQHGRWKKCVLCNRRVEYVATKNGQVVREPGFAGFTGLCSDAARALWIAPPGCKPAERVEVHDALALFRETRGRLIADSGCKRSVAGKSWHEETQAWLAERGLKASRTMR